MTTINSLSTHLFQFRMLGRFNVKRNSMSQKFNEGVIFFKIWNVFLLRKTIAHFFATGTGKVDYLI